MTVVGVVPDPVVTTLDAEAYPHVYVPAAQSGVSTYFVPRSLRIAVRADWAATALVPGIRAAVAEFDRKLPLDQIGTIRPRSSTRSRDRA